MVPIPAGSIPWTRRQVSYIPTQASPEARAFIEATEMGDSATSIELP